MNGPAREPDPRPSSFGLDLSDPEAPPEVQLCQLRITEMPYELWYYRDIPEEHCHEECR